ncbi:ABC transporter permease [Limisalsivibrio acetivorans]|uniref:ABC transporter permease n=1 Tax=Limisalsivibrio acetivorans TaxID=1304888 RepID=UPI0003B62BA3|nr:FtsX-like permease family protein [Limisalsivibrio acetivorans]
MNIITIPFRNLRRKALRTFLLTAVFTAGILSVVGLYYVSASIGESLESKLTAYGANILIRPGSDSLDVSYGGFSMGNLSYNVQKLQQQTVEDGVLGIELKERISAVAPKLLETFSLNGREFAAAGVNWTEELKIKSYWFIHGEQQPGKDDIIAGSQAASVLGLKQGETVELDGRSFNVAGVLAESGTDDDRLVFMDIGALQSVKNRPGEVTFVEVSALCAGCPIGDIVVQIEKNLPGADITAMQNVVKQRMFTIGFVQKLVLAVSGVILVTACFMLAVFMMASVAERRSEIGILRSMGYSRFKVFFIFTFEAVFIGIISALAGFYSGLFTADELLKRMDLVEAAGSSFVPSHLLISIGVVTLISVAASIVPAVKAARTEPASAIVRL